MFDFIEAKYLRRQPTIRIRREASKFYLVVRGGSDVGTGVKSDFNRKECVFLFFMIVIRGRGNVTLAGRRASRSLRRAKREKDRHMSGIESLWDILLCGVRASVWGGD